MTEEPKLRALDTVIDQMLALIPFEHPLRERFEWLKGDIRYKAPEQQWEGWYEASEMLTNELGPPDSLTEDWQRAVVNIFTNTPVEVQEHNQ